MDLGFGNNNQQMGNATANLMLQTAKAQEQAIVDEMAAYDALLEDDDALEMLRAKRLAEMKQHQRDRQNWKALGHGTYTELAGSDVAKAFFEASKQSARMVVHFYRPTTTVCDVFHAHLAKLAPKHLETRFLKINVEGCDQGSGGAASYLVEKLGIIVMPTVIIIQDRKVEHHLHGFDELGGSTEFSTRALEYVLGVHGGIQMAEDAEVPQELLPENQEGVNSIRIRGGSRTDKGKKQAVRDGISSGEYYDENY